MKDKVRIGIIGTGFAKTVQIPAFHKIDGAEIVSIVSAHLENAEAVARDFGIPHFTDDWRETVKNENVDLICITTPPVFHKEMVLLALENDKHILCEKPMAMTADEAREMTEKAAEKNVLALIDHELRFLNGRRAAREIIESGEIGKIRHAKYNFRAPHRGSPDAPWNWWSDIKSGGGALGAIGSHVFDSLRWFLSAEVSDVFCQLQTHVKERRDEKSGAMKRVSTDDEANLILRFADGEFCEDATANLSLSMVEYPVYQNRVEFFGTKGAIRVEFDGEFFIGKAGEEAWHKAEVDLNEAIEGARNTGWNNGFLALAAEIVQAIKDGKNTVENAATFADGYRVQLLMDAARQSNANGTVVKLQ
ncbi:MAG: Gfo/Idh/MocA family oxidoreductase [Pyrinomonadaceae bacterium]|nr:Gfo/Idh/MocA family oxidoreductase [Pyrinomonadaceae bacterium]